MNLRPGTAIFGVNSSGRVFSLSKDEGRWREFDYLGIEFKRVSAARNVVWAVGGDHQVYVFVYGVEVPIRVKEITYENERWNPMEGFCSKLLPTDRPNYSIIEGTQAREKESVHLPTMAWMWDDEWHIDTLFNGVQLPIGGWTYAVDFPTEYHPKKGFTSCVRRRRWIRHRKYVATNSWSAVPGIHRDSGEEPFIDVSVGGGEIPGGREEELMVWSVTVAGRVMVRQGVTNTCPEGTGWLNIPTPIGKEVSQLSVAPSGLVWAVTWQGSVLVRLGVTMIDPTGISWCEVGQPRPEHPLSVVAVGTAIVWGVTRGGSVWFRQGVRSDCGGETEQLARGSKWIQMVGEVNMVSVGLGDQLLAVGAGDRPVLVRTGVSASDLSGKTWRPLTAPANGSSNIGSVPFRRRLESDRSCSGSYKEQSSLASYSGKLSGSPDTITESSITSQTSGPKPPEPGTFLGINSDDAKTKAAAVGEKVLVDTEKRMVGLAVGTVARTTLGRVPLAGPFLAGAVGGAVMDEINKSQIIDQVNQRGKEVVGSSGQELDKSDDQFRPCKANPLDVSSESTEVSLADDVPPVLDMDESIYSSTMESLEPSGRLVLDWEDQYEGPDWGQDTDPVWVWVTLGGCQLDQVPQAWLLESNMSVCSLSIEEEPWRRDLLSKLSRNNKVVEGEKFKEYKTAIESSSWVKKGLVRVNTGGSRSRWEQAAMELEQCGTKEGQVDFGTLSMFGQKTSTKEHLSLSELTCVSICSERSSPQLAVHTAARSARLQPVLVKFASEAELYDWHADLVAGMNCVHGTMGRPGMGSVFSVTGRGEVMVFDPQAAKRVGEEENTVVGSQYSQEIEVEGRQAPGVWGGVVEKLANGFGAGSALYTEIKIGESCETFALNLQCGKIGAASNDISLHFNPRLSSNHIVLNSFESLSGVWGFEEKQPLVVMVEQGTAVRAFTPGQTVQLVIKAETSRFEIFVNGVKFAAFKYRIKAENVTHFKLAGNVEVLKVIYSSRSAIIPPTDMYWRSLGGGHFLQVETCPLGVVWGLGYDSTPWVYTGGWGGATFKGQGTSQGNVHPMHDQKYFYIYENQRWNPLTGFTSSGLPTDRHMWSDKSGAHPATKEGVRLPGGGWAWTGDWVVDHHTPGGTDKDGWQFAKDFPASYHPSQAFTDYVRRRRWARRCRLVTSGPWVELGTTKLLDISLQPYISGEGGEVRCWAVATNGEALYRMGVTRDCPAGVGWSHVRSDTLFQGVTVGADGSVWLVSSEGQVYLRQGVADSSPAGQVWVQLSNPDCNTRFRCVEGGRAGLWAVDTSAKLWIRRGVSVQFPEGTSWGLVCPNVRSVSCGDTGDLWAVVDECNGVNGVLARRGGVTPSNPGGEEWDYAVGGGWKHLSVRGWVK